MSGGENPVLIDIGDTLYYSLGLSEGFCCGPGEPMPSVTGAWSSTDGVTWTPVDIGQGVVSDGAVGAGVVVMTGHQLVDGGPGTIATIWASPAE